MNKGSKEDYDAFREDFRNVCQQVINYIEGFHLATRETGDFTDIISNHHKLSLEVEEMVFNKLKLSSLKYDIRYYYSSLWLDRKEIYRISDEAYYHHIIKLVYKFRLKDHKSDPSLINPYFNELFNLINIQNEDKNRFIASLSSIMTQIIRDILEVPTDRTRFALVLYGSQGCGKTTFLTTLCKIVQGEDVNLQKNDFYSNFDSEEMLKPVFRIEDLDYKFRDCIDKIKSIITNVGVTTVNVKYKPEQRVIIRTTPLMDTNRDFINIIKTDGEQRRFCIFELGESQRIEYFEEKLEECLEKIFQIHTTEYFYDINKISKKNLELTDTQSEFMDQIMGRLYELSHKKQGSDDSFWEAENKLPDCYYKKTYKAREFKQFIKDELVRFDPNDSFLSDGLLMKIQERFFYKIVNDHTHRPEYTIKKISKTKEGTFTLKSNSGVSGVSGVNKKTPLEENETETYFKYAAIAAIAATLTNLIPNLTEVDNPKDITYEDFILFYRDKYIYDRILTPQIFLFYGDDKIDPTDSVKNTPIIVNPNDFEISTKPRLYVNHKARGDQFNTLFPEEIHLEENVDDFKLFVQWDNICSSFIDDTAKNENFISSNLIPVDIDDHNDELNLRESIGEIDRLGLEYYIVQSKGGKGYHIYFPTSHHIKDVEYYAIIARDLYDKIIGVGLTPDENCKNPSRKFFATFNTRCIDYHKGKKIDIIEVLQKYYDSKDNNEIIPLNKSSKIKINPVEKNLSYKKSDKKDCVEGEVSENNDLTDQYFMGFRNEGMVVSDLPHIIGYLMTLKDNNKEFYSLSNDKYILISEVIEKVKETVSYDNSHVMFIDYLIEKHNRDK
jgi:energy-coupling factor transporter ATP-binding protein EcfA2